MSKTDTWKSWEGRIIQGKFPLRQWLGGSDHSAVFLTERPGKPTEKAAIKLIDAERLDAQREVARLQAAAALSHPHLISIFDAGSTRIDGASVVYAVIEYADEDLAQILPQRPLSPNEVGDMIPPILDALSYLHAKGFVHSRVKPSNVHAAADQLKLSADQILPANENAKGRRIGVYDAPEIASGKLSPASDVWSLGVTIITALTQQAMPASAAAQADPGLPGNLPEPFRGITRECLHIEPERRSSLDEVRARLRPPARSPAVEKPAKVAGERDSSRLPIFVIPIVLLVIALAAWGLFHSRGENTSDGKAETLPKETASPSANQPAPPPKPSPSAPGTESKSSAPPVTAPAPVRRGTASGGSVVHQVIPDIPRSARNTITGTIKVTVRVDVDASGNVSSAKLKTSGPSKYFAGKAMQAAEQWQFSPPTADGQPTSSAWLLTFRFRRGSTQASPERLNR